MAVVAIFVSVWGIYKLYNRYVRLAVDRRDHRRDLDTALAGMSTVERQQLAADVLQIAHADDHTPQGKHGNWPT